MGFIPNSNKRGEITLRIGIDIDDTLTDIREQLTNAVFEYAKELNKKVENENIEINDVNNDGNIYQKKFNFSYEELKYFLGPIQESITNNAIPRKDCVEVIKKLHAEGNEVYIITARDSEFHEDPYQQSMNWLNKNDIYFDKLIVNARDKKKVCLDENIDILIDDSISNCKNVISGGISAIMITNSNIVEKDNISCFENWIDIYNYLHECKND